MRVHELAKELNITSKELIEKANEVLGLSLKSHSSTVGDNYISKIRSLYSGAPQKPQSKPKAFVVKKQKQVDLFFSWIPLFLLCLFVSHTNQQNRFQNKNNAFLFQIKVFQRTLQNNKKSVAVFVFQTSFSSTLANNSTTSSQKKSLLVQKTCVFFHFQTNKFSSRKTSLQHVLFLKQPKVLLFPFFVEFLMCFGERFAFVLLKNRKQRCGNNAHRCGDILHDFVFFSTKKKMRFEGITKDLQQLCEFHEKSVFAFVFTTTKQKKRTPKKHGKKRQPTLLVVK